MPTEIPMRRKALTKIINARGGVSKNSEVMSRERWPKVINEATPRTASQGGAEAADPIPTKCQACA